jgi:phage terminase small subunit
MLHEGSTELTEGGGSVEKSEWVTRITASCRAAGTYREWFTDVIDTLAAILERRDEAEVLFDEQGGEVLIEHTNKAGATNFEQNPILRMINDLNRDALAYWRDLGLTPAGLKKIDEAAMKPMKKSALGEALKGLGG